jgi:hypothetical protein
VKPKIRVGDRNYIFDNYLKIRLAILRKMNAFYLTPVKKTNSGYQTRLDKELNLIFL